MTKAMILKNKLYQDSVITRIAETDWQKGNAAPFVVELDPTAVCDLACPGCISEDLISQGNRFSDERLMQLGQEFIDSGVRAVILIGGGEPLAHRRIGDFMTLMGQNDIHLGITTNGSFIDRYLEPIARYAQWTRVSVDAATDETFRVLRPSKGNARSKFDKIIANMRQLAARKTGKLGFSFLVQTPADGPGIISNAHEIYDAAVLARDIGCDYFEVKPSYQFRGGTDHALMQHEAADREVAKRQIARLDALETEHFRVVHAINLEESLNGVANRQAKNYQACPSAQLRTTVTPTGVFVCPYWRGKDNKRIGDVVTQSFQEMWHGERRQAVMEQLDASSDCRFHCLRHETNLAAFQIKDALDGGGGGLRPVAEFDRFI